MKRPIFIITLGFLIGILWGLYFYIVFYFLGVILILMLLFCILSNKARKNILRVIKVFFNKKAIIIFAISLVIAFIYVKFSISKYEYIYKTLTEGRVIGTVISEKDEKEYVNTYVIKIESFENCEKNYGNKDFILKIPIKKDEGLKYGDQIEFYGKYIEPAEARNYCGFNYKEYLKTQKLYGIFETDKIRNLKSNNIIFINRMSYNIKQGIIGNIRKILPSDTSELFLGILIGYDKYLQEDIKLSFSKSSLTHLLAVSGTHIIYIIAGLTIIFKIIKLSKTIRNIIIIVFLVIFMFITDFSPSVVRAGIVGIIALIPTLIYRKNDITITMCVPVILILLYNPYKILDIGLILSYFATLGILVYTKIRNQKKENTNNKYVKFFGYFKDLFLITIFANMFIFPIIIYNFNTVSLTFFISNILASVVIGVITIGGMFLIILSFISKKIAIIFSIPYNFTLKILIIISRITSNIPFSQVILVTPSKKIIIIYYIVLILIFISIYFSKRYPKRYLIKKISKLIKNIICIVKKNYKIIIFLTIFIILFNYFIVHISKKLNIYFIDVGQGDSTLVITPENKKVLIDGGGSETDSFNVGQSVLYPYLLDRGIKKIDYIFISHFDSDHCKGIFYILENLEVNSVIIGKQFKISENYNKFINIIEKKKIKMFVVEAGQNLNIEKNVSINILWPDSNNIIQENVINNNSLVFRLNYKDFSLLFTGDIEEVAESEMLKKYKNNLNILKSKILKVAHHGSKTSSSFEFLEMVNPQVAFIGVGKDNKFGHPNNSTLINLSKIKSTYFRTDESGEINIEIDKKIIVKKFIN